ncbi:MAG TPA: alpha/beta hydrolase [Flavobacteriales bacterium]|nr:alpha/beta hydrolase [Flavobacteriales bacterium]
MSTLRRILKALFALLLLWLILVQTGCFSMRTAEKQWPADLAAKGQERPVRFIEAKSTTGRTMHAVTMDATDSLPVVLAVHGSPGSADNYMDYFADTVFLKKVKLIAVDRPGFGWSGYGDPEPSLQKQAMDLLAVLDAEEPAKKVILVGHSLGGPLIARFAMDHPDRTAGLVIVAGSIDPDLEPRPWWQSRIDRAPLSWFIPRPMWTSNHEIMTLRYELQMMLPRWKNITCPVHVLHATDDQLVDFGNTAFAREHLVHADPLVVDTMHSGNHFILWNHRDRVRAAVFELIDQQRVQ